MATYPNSTTCPACGKWTVQGANYCHHCANPLKAQFKSDAPGLVIDTPSPRQAGNHWLNTDGGRWLTGAFIVVSAGVVIAWLNGYEVGQGAAVATGVAALGGSGLALAKWYIERKPAESQMPAPSPISVMMHEQLASGWRTYLDQFLDPSITVDDLARLSKADGFSRSAAKKAGLSQDKWHKIKGEFLRLNYCVPLPNGGNGYTLTLRGVKLLAKIGDTGTNNNKQQG